MYYFIFIQNIHMYLPLKFLLTCFNWALTPDVQSPTTQERTLYIVNPMFMVTITARADTTTTLHVSYKAIHADHFPTQGQTIQNVCTARMLVCETMMVVLPEN